MIKLELNERMVEIIGQALGTMPFNTVASVIAELQKQIAAQQNPIPDLPKVNGKIRTPFGKPKIVEPTKETLS